MFQANRIAPDEMPRSVAYHLGLYCLPLWQKYDAYMSLFVRKPVFGVSDTNRAVQPQKMTRGLKFRIKIVEELYNPYSENKGADQLRGYHEADLRLCFCICKKLVFSRHGSYRLSSYVPVLPSLISLCCVING